jgi:GT2 family glycosyltransferase
VLVTCCGQLEYTRLCVPRLLQHTRPPFELQFLQPDSLDGTPAYLAEVAARAPDRVAIVRSGRVGAEHTDTIKPRGDFVVFLTNDTLVTDGWLAPLVALACSNPALAMVAPHSNYAPAPALVDMVPDPLGPADESRPGEDRLDSMTALGEEVDRFARQWREQHRGQWSEADILGGGCVLVKRPVLQALKGFPRGTVLRTFDLEGYSRQVREAGYRLAVCGDVFVHHFGTRTVCRR